MPFCTQCGNHVGDTDTFCAKCGFRQARTTSRAAVDNDLLKNVTPRTASMLCYVPYFGWIAAVVALASTRFHNDRVVRFHAFQGIYLFVAWLIVDWVVSPVFHAIPSPNPMRAMAGLMHAVVLVAWVWMIVKTSQEQMFRLPILGELAERSLAEQR